VTSSLTSLLISPTFYQEILPDPSGTGKGGQQNDPSGWNGVTRRWEQTGGRLANLALGLMVMLLLLGLPAWQGTEVAALGLPGWGKPWPKQGAPLAGRASGGLQEVSPPSAVQQLREALSVREPRVTIEAPVAETLLPDGPWILRLHAEDWPLVDAGPLGLGPHLVVQLDDAIPRRVTSTEVTMPPLEPGSHRLTVYAAWPWGEAVKNPGAWRQVRLHRVAENPLSLPARGSPQLLGVSPTAPAAAEPVLVDWLLIDAPLQHLRDNDASWRLRISVNSDSFLVDRQTPLWLEGWRVGSNALQLELVDPHGAPLNPPFNSLVREVRLDPEALRPPWLAARLSDSDLARLLGEAPPELPESQIAPAEPEPELEPQLEPEPQPEPEASQKQEGEPMADDPGRAKARPQPPSWPGQQPDRVADSSNLSESADPIEPPAQQKSTTGSGSATPLANAPAVEEQERLVPAQTQEPLAPQEVLQPLESGPRPRAPRMLEEQATSLPAEPEPSPARETNSLDIAPGSAREELNADGTMIRTESPGLLARLRRRLGR